MTENSLNRGTSFVRQAAILAAASLFVRFIGFIYRIPLTNRIGDEGIAYYIAAYSVYTFAIALSSGSLPAAVSRLVSERIARRQYHNAHTMFKQAMIFAVTLGGICGLFMFVAANQLAALVSAPGAAAAVRTLGPTMLVVAPLAVFRGYFQGMKTALPTAISQIIEQIFKVIFTLWLTALFFDATNLGPAVAGATAGTGIAGVAGLLVVAFMYICVRSRLLSRAKRDTQYHLDESKFTQIGTLMYTALPIIVSMVIFSSSNILDLRMAINRMISSGAFTTEEARTLVGQFTGKFLLLTTLPISLSVALSSAVIPEITSSNVEMDISAVKQKTNMALRLSMMLSIPAAVGLAVLADPIIALLFPGHPDGGWLLRYGAVSIIFIALVHVLTGVLQGLGLVKLPMIAAFCGVVIKIPINHVLIGVPRINVLGAVISTIACFVLAAGINMYFLYKHTKILPSFSAAFVKPLLASGTMGMVCFVAYNLAAIIIPTWAATIGALVAGGLSYIAFMCIIKGFKKEDIQAAPLPRPVRKLLQRFI